MMAHRRRADVLGVQVEAVNLDAAVAMLLRCAKAKDPSYACLVGAHGIVEAHRSREVLQAFSGASFLLPDGMPTVWIGRAQGFREMDRVFGPDLMLRIVDEGRTIGLRHFLLGGKEGVAEELAAVLRNKFPGASIVETYTPPFSALTAEQETDLARRIARGKPDVVWLGISTPKQDLFMQEHAPRWCVPLMVGVGAAFDFHTGRLKDSPSWVKRSGLQWLHRLLQEPRRLWRRYLVTNSYFIALVILRALGLGGCLQGVTDPHSTLKAPSFLE